MKVTDLAKVRDKNGNALKYDSVRGTVSRYKYVDPAYTSGADSVGTVSLCAMIVGLATSLGISLVLYDYMRNYR